MKNDRLQVDHENLLKQLGDSFFNIAKRIKLQQGDALTCLTPALDKTILIVGTQGNINVKHISTLLSITPGATTQHITALEKENAIRRVINNKDRREIIVCLTAHGKELFEKIKINQLKLMEKMFSGLNDNDLQILVGLITKASINNNEGET
jgi:DNA-binding MarR family transcriptional regulator